MKGLVNFILHIILTINKHFSRCCVSKVLQYIFWIFIKLYIKIIVNQHFNFLCETITSHCLSYCYELFHTKWISVIKRCKMNSNGNIMLLHKLVIDDWTFSNYFITNSGNNLQIFCNTITMFHNIFGHSLYSPSKLTLDRLIFAKIFVIFVRFRGVLWPWSRFSREYEDNVNSLMQIVW